MTMSRFQCCLIPSLANVSHTDSHNHLIFLQYCHHDIPFNDNIQLSRLALTFTDWMDDDDNGDDALSTTGNDSTAGFFNPSSTFAAIQQTNSVHILSRVQCCCWRHWNDDSCRPGASSSLGRRVVSSWMESKNSQYGRCSAASSVSNSRCNARWSTIQVL